MKKNEIVSSANMGDLQTKYSHKVVMVVGKMSSLGLTN
jgi:hypothetical protein